MDVRSFLFLDFYLDLADMTEYRLVDFKSSADR